jgi:hypothetical protein
MVWMIVASVNANKRLSAEAARARFGSWLEGRGVTLALVQEAWRVGAPVAPRLPGMKLLGGDHELAVWACEAGGRLVVERRAEWWQTSPRMPAGARGRNEMTSRRRGLVG